MKPRVECSQCIHFIQIVQESENLLSKITTNAKCNLGYRVMFRKPTIATQMYSNEGYFRYCDEFVQ